MGDFLNGYVVPTAIIVAEVIAIVVPLLIAIAYLTYAERKVLAAMQLRRGPNVVGPFGLLQPFADGLKLLNKETVIPSGANRVVFIAAPMITFLSQLVIVVLSCFAGRGCHSDQAVRRVTSPVRRGGGGPDGPPPRWFVAAEWTSCRC